MYVLYRKKKVFYEANTPSRRPVQVTATFTLSRCNRSALHDVYSEAGNFVKLNERGVAPRSTRGRLEVRFVIRCDL